MTRDNYLGILTRLWLCAGVVESEPVAEMLAHAERAQAIGPFINPTLYMDKADAMMEDMALLRALLPVQECLRRMKARRAPR